MRDEIYGTGEGNGDLCNIFTGLWGSCAPIRHILLSQGSRNVLELEGAL